MMINDLPYIMIRCLLCTILIEVIFSLIIGVRNKKDILNIILVNMITNPIVVIVPVCLNIFCSLQMRNISLIILEILTLFSEGFVYKKYLYYKRINPFMISLLLNGSSYFMGEIINRFL